MNVYRYSNEQRCAINAYTSLVTGNGNDMAHFLYLTIRILKKIKGRSENITLDGIQ